MIDVIGFLAEVVDHLVLPEFAHNQMPADDVLAAAIRWLLSRGLVSLIPFHEDCVQNVDN